MDVSIINRYRMIQNSYESSSKKETDLNELKIQIARSFGNSIDYESSTKVDDATQKLIVIHTDNEFKKKIIAYPNEDFSIGNTVDCYDTNWLITKVDSNKQVYTIGEMTQCNLLLRWQNSSGEIINRHAVVEKAINTDLNEGNIITTSQKQYSIKLPFDLETQNLFVGKRFLLEKANGTPLAYSLSSYDGITSNYGQGGLLNIVLTQDEFNSTVDNAELMIADYFSPTPQPSGNAEITFSGKSEIYVGGSWKYFTAKFTDAEGNVISNVIPVWSLITLPEHEHGFEKEVLSDNRFRVKSKLDERLMGGKVKILLDDSDGLYHTELIVEVVDLG